MQIKFRKQSGFAVIETNNSERAKTIRDKSKVYSKRVRQIYMRNSLLVSTDEAWIEVPISREWIAAYSVVIQNGKPVIAEVRIFPEEANRDRPGRWSAEYLGMKAKVPAGGITARLIRQVKPGEHYRGLQKFLEWAKQRGWAPLDEVESEPSSKVGRKAKPDTFYVKFAADYARAVERGSSSPVKDVSEKLGLSDRKKVRAMIHQCRKRKLLDPVIQGKPGGLLTPYAKQLLKCSEQCSETTGEN